MRLAIQAVFAGGLLLSLCFSPALVSVGLAQAPTPLEDLNIALWPEYDRPEVLVIYQGRLAEDVSLPASVSLTLPASVPELSAVAYLDETQGRLLNIPDYQFTEVASGKALSFATPSRQFHFEYYSPDILSINGAMRNLAFSFTPNAPVADLTIEVQQPTTTQAFSSDPPPTSTQVRQDGLTYALFEMGPVSAEDTRSLQASYTRSSDGLSSADLATIDVPTAPEETPVEVGGGGLRDSSSADLGTIDVPTSPEETPVEVGGGGLRDSLGPILIAVGVLVLTGSLIYWFWSQRAVVVPEAAPRQAPARPRRTSRRGPTEAKTSPTPTEDRALALYCHRCGTKFRDDARFCHACGAERRAQ